jgi:signal transduction histidine kinase
MKTNMKPMQAKIASPLFSTRFANHTTPWQNKKDFIASQETIITTEAGRKQAVAEIEGTAKSDFIANINHEIRTPLGAMVGLIHILLATQLDDKQKKCLTVMQSCAEDLMVLINKSLEIDKIESQILEPEQAVFHLGSLLQNVVSILSVKAEEKNIRLKLDRAATLNTACNGDYGRIRQIMMNLVGNAIKFTEVGEVRVALALKPTTGGKTQISVSVKDTGIGIPADKTGTIFQRFVQADTTISRKFGGTGLGLAISKALAESMGGTLSVTSVLGQGSTFHLKLLLPTTENTVKSGSFDESQINIRETAYLSKSAGNLFLANQQVSS